MAGEVERFTAHYSALQVPVPRSPKKIQGFSFNNSRPIQGCYSSRSSYSIQPYWYSRKKDTQIRGIHSWHLL